MAGGVTASCDTRVTAGSVWQTQAMNSPETPLPPLTLRNYDRADMAGLVLTLKDRRAVLVNVSGSHHDYRVWTEPVAGQIAVVTEEAWWRHKYLAMTPQVTRWPAAACWVEV